MKEDGTEWLPVMECDGVEYVVDIQNRRLGQWLNPAEIMAFHSDAGRRMAGTMGSVEEGIRATDGGWPGRGGRGRGFALLTVDGRDATEPGTRLRVRLFVCPALTQHLGDGGAVDLLE